MKDALGNGAPVAAWKRQRWSCFFLAFFLLYNPFHTSLRGTSSLEVCHPASHRATVGATELQHFTPAAGWDPFSTVDLAEVEAPVSLLVVAAETALAIPRLVVPAQQFFGAGLWFRPPPAL